MITPPLLLAAALLLWGAVTGLLPYAIAMAALLEGSRRTAWRWKLDESDQNRVADLCSVLFVGMVVYAVSRSQADVAIYSLLQWSPMAVFPLVAVQAYGADGRIRLTALFYSLRRVREHRERIGSADLSYPYLALCLLAASAVSQPTWWFYPICGALLGWALWGTSSRERRGRWTISLALALALGYGVQGGLHRAQLALEDLAGAWLSDLFRHETDPYRATTAIGDIGRLKLSDRILLRVTSSGQPPPLLRQASYNTYTTYTFHRGLGSLAVGTWFAKRASFRPVSTENGVTWDLARAPAGAGHEVTVSGYLDHGKGLLALPAGTYRIGRLLVDRVEHNPLGAVEVTGGPGLVTYVAQYGTGAPADEPPVEEDLQIPRAYRTVLRKLAKDLHLADLDPPHIVHAVQVFFSRHFSYSLAPLEAGTRAPSLDDFLLRVRAGHCEYFATATALLLREAGVPARYAVGYAVREFSPREGRYLIRSRHAHSWVLAYFDGRWQDVDTTPPQWTAIEAEEQPPWEALYDLWSWALYAYAQWLSTEGDSGLRAYLAWLLIPLVAILAWRLRSTERVRQDLSAPEVSDNRPRGPGHDSELYAVLDRLRLQGFEQPPGEPLGKWLTRLGPQWSDPGLEARLRALLDLHYRYRFDPRGLSPEQREQLRAGVREWLQTAD